MFKRMIKKGAIREMDPEKAAIFIMSNSLSIYEEMNKFILDIFVNGFFTKK